MASPPSISEQSTGSSSTTEGSDDTHGVLEQVTPGLVTSIRAVGFWTAIAMPFLYLPLLATGLSSSFDGVLFFCLVVGNLLALYVGHPHHQ